MARKTEKEEKKTVFTRESLLTLKPEPRECVVKGYEQYGTFFVRQITSGERLRLSLLLDDGQPVENAYEKAVILGICDEQGVPLFTDADMAELKNLPMDLVQGMGIAVMRCNTIDVDEIEILKGN